MSLDFSVSNQAEALDHQFKAFLYQKLFEASKGSCLIRLTGPAVGIVSAIFTIATRIALIAENLFKAAINTFGCCCHSNLSCGTGMSQLFCQVTKNILFLPVSILSAIVGIVCKTILIATLPTETLQQLWFKHDPNEKAKQEAETAELQRQLRIAGFQNAQKEIESDPNNIRALKHLAAELQLGAIIYKDDKQSLHYFERAAVLGDPISMCETGRYYLNGIKQHENDNTYLVQPDHKKALEWVSKSAAANCVQSYALMGALYEQGEQKNAVEATRWHLKAAEYGNVESMFLYGTRKALGNDGVTKDYFEAVKWLKKAALEEHHNSRLSYTALIWALPHLDRENSLFPLLDKWKLELSDVTERRLGLGLGMI